MTSGQLIAVVGPSGVGKDSVIDALVAARADFRRIKRVITRAPGLSGENYTAATPAAFQAAAEKGDFCLEWSAHGLSYGIPKTVLADVLDGSSYVGNLSRGMLARADAVFPELKVLSVTAAPETLAQRLADRRRESAADVAQRLARTVSPLPSGLDVIEISNDGPLETTVRQALAALAQERRVS